MVGIYKIENILNNKVYIGQSVNIELRWKAHISESKNKAKSQISKAIKEYGLNNFNFSVLEECEREQLNEREKYWIFFYNSYNNGYNRSIGGEIYSDCSGEKNPRSILTKEDVEDIRECFNNHVPFREVYKKYSEKISKRGLQKVWYFETWKNIHPEYNTLENKKWHNTVSKQMKVNPNAFFSEEDVLKIRILKNQGFNRYEIYEKYKNDICFETFENMWYGITYKSVK